jgi:hypothetical protein
MEILNLVNRVVRAIRFSRASKLSVLGLIVVLGLILLANLAVRWRYSVEEDRMVGVYGVPCPYRILFDEIDWGRPCPLLSDSPVLPFCLGALICDVLVGLLTLLGFWALLFRAARRLAIRRCFGRRVMAGAGGVLVLAGVCGFVFEEGAYREQRAILAEIRHNDEDSFVWIEYPGPHVVWSLVRSVASRWYPPEQVRDFLDAAIGTVVRIQGNSRVAQFVPKLAGVRSIAIDDYNLGDAACEAIPRLDSRRLERVSLTLNDWRDVTNILDLPRLRFLTICGDPGAEFLRQMHRIKSLEVLDMGGSMSLSEGFIRFREFPKLRVVSFFEDGVTVKTLRDINGMKCLEDLDVTTGEIGDEEIRELRNLPSLKTLCLGECQVGDEGLKSIARLRQLRCLNLSRAVSERPITDAGLKFVASLPKLEKLYLEGTRVTDKGMATLSAIPNLRTLDIGKSRAPPAGLASLVACQTLSTLVLDSTSLDSSAGSALSRIKGLESLDLSRTNFGDAGVAAIRSLGALQTLKLGWTPVSDECISYLLELNALREVWLDGTGVTPAGAARMKALPNLRMLFLYDCPGIPPDALFKLQTLMPKVDIMHPIIHTGPAPAPRVNRGPVCGRRGRAKGSEVVSIDTRRVSDSLSEQTKVSGTNGTVGTLVSARSAQSGLWGRKGDKSNY